MVELTLQISNSLATKIQSFGIWGTAIIEISLLNCTTKAGLTAREIIVFLEKNPLPKEVLHFKVSEKAQNRLRNLLSKNREGILSNQELKELDELEKIEHIFSMLKLHIAHDLKNDTPNNVN